MNDDTARKAERLQPRYRWRGTGNRRHTVDDERTENIITLMTCAFLASAITVVLMKIVEVV